MKKSILICTFLLSLLLIFFNITSFASELNSNIESFDASSLIKSDGTYWVWGNGLVSPIQIHGLSDVKKSFSYQLVTTKDNRVFFWDRSIPTGNTQVYNIPQLNNLIDVRSGGRVTLALDQEGKVYLISTQAKLNPTQLDQIKPLTDINNIIDMSNYYEYTPQSIETRWVFLNKDGSVWRNNVRFPSESFEPIKSLDHVIDIEQNIALKRDGTVWSWTDEITDESGVQYVAQPISQLTNIQTIKSFGTRKSNIAIDRNSSLWYWGGTVTGYSDGTTTHRQTVPVKLTSIKNVKDAFVVERSLVVLTNDGKVYKTSIQREAMPEDPVFDLLMSDAYQIKADLSHIIIQKNDGSLWGWGYNKNGELGVGDYEIMYTSPQRMQRPVSVYLNDESIVLNNGVIIRSGQAFIPLRSIFEKMGATLNWDGSSKTVTISKSKTNQLPIDIVINYTSGNVLMNNQPVELSNPSFIIGSTAYLPLRFVSESLGAKVDWIHNEDRISILVQ